MTEVKLQIHWAKVKVLASLDPMKSLRLVFHGLPSFQRLWFVVPSCMFSTRVASSLLSSPYFHLYIFSL